MIAFTGYGLCVSRDIQYAGCLNTDIYAYPAIAGCCDAHKPMGVIYVNAVVGDYQCDECLDREELLEKIEAFIAVMESREAAKEAAGFRHLFLHDNAVNGSNWRQAPRQRGPPQQLPCTWDFCLRMR